MWILSCKNMLACVITDRSMKKPNLYLPIHILSGSEKKVGRLVGETFNVKPCRGKKQRKVFAKQAPTHCNLFANNIK